MKKILFIMILATTFIPVTQIGATNKGMDERYKVKTTDSQISLNPVSELLDVENINNQLPPDKIKTEHRIKRTHRAKELLPRKSITGRKKDRLFGILLLAYGSKQ